MEVFSYVLGKKAGSGGSGEPTGTINITSNGTKNVKSYAYADVNVQPKLETKTITIEENGTTTITPTSGKDGLSSVSITTNVSDIDWSEIGYESEPKSIQDDFDYAKEIYDNWDTSITSTNSMFIRDYKLTYFPNVDTSNVTDMTQMFLQAYSLKEIGNIDFSNCEKCSSMFSSCSSLKKVGNVNVKDGADISYLFYYCYALEEVGSINISSESCTNLFSNCQSLRTIGSINSKITKMTTRNNNMFSNCKSLTNESLNKVLGFLKTLTEQPSDKRKLGWFAIPETLWDTCVTLPNWQDLENAGWTASY